MAGDLIPTTNGGALDRDSRRAARVVSRGLTNSRIRQARVDDETDVTLPRRCRARHPGRRGSTRRHDRVTRSASGASKLAAIARPARRGADVKA